MKNNPQQMSLSKTKAFCFNAYSRNCYSCIYPSRDELIKNIKELWNQNQELELQKENEIKEKDLEIKVIQQKYNDDINGYKNKVYELEKKIQSLEDQKAFNDIYQKEKIEKQEKKIKQLKEQIVSLNQQIYENQKQIQQSYKEISNQKINDLLKQVDEYKDQIQKMNYQQQNIETLEKKINSQSLDTVAKIQTEIKESQDQIKDRIQQKEQKIFDKLKRQKERIEQLKDENQNNKQQYYVDKEVQRLEKKIIRNGRSYHDLNSQTQPLFKPMIERITYEIKFINDQNQNNDIPRLKIKSDVYFDDVLDQLFEENPNLDERRIRKVKILKSGVIIPKNEWNKQIYLILGQSKEIQHDIQLISEN